MSTEKFKVTSPSHSTIGLTLEQGERPDQETNELRRAADTLLRGVAACRPWTGSINTPFITPLKQLTDDRGLLTTLLYLCQAYGRRL